MEMSVHIWHVRVYMFFYCLSFTCFSWACLGIPTKLVMFVILGYHIEEFISQMDSPQYISFKTKIYLSVSCAEPLSYFREIFHLFIWSISEYFRKKCMKIRLDPLSRFGNYWFSIFLIDMKEVCKELESFANINELLEETTECVQSKYYTQYLTYPSDNECS